MRILMLCESYLSIGGVAEVVDNLAAAFEEMQHQVAVVSNPFQVAKRARSPRSHADYFPIRIPRRRPFTWRHPERLVRRPHASEFLQTLRRWSPDLVNFQGPLWERMPAAFDACRSAKIPVVLTLHDLVRRRSIDEPAEHGEIDPRQLKCAAALSFVSGATKDSFEAIAPCAHAGEVILNGVDCLSAQNSAPCTYGRPYIFSAARINLQHKAMDVLVQAFSALANQYPALDLLITGDGPDRDDLARMVSALGLDTRVRLLGVVPRGELWSLYKGAKLFAMPSHKPEGLGLAFLESMACGRPVIGTDSGGTPEIVRHGENGLLVERNRPELVSAAIRRLLDNSDERERMGRAGREMVNARFSWAAVAQKYLRLFDRTVSASS